jgi:hypothetical protein
LPMHLTKAIIDIAGYFYADRGKNPSFVLTTGRVKTRILM